MLHCRVIIDYGNNYLTFPPRCRLEWNYDHLIPIEDTVAGHGISRYLQQEDHANRQVPRRQGNILLNILIRYIRLRRYRIAGSDLTKQWNQTNLVGGDRCSDIP